MGYNTCMTDGSPKNGQILVIIIHPQNRVKRFCKPLLQRKIKKKNSSSSFVEGNFVFTKFNLSM